VVGFGPGNLDKMTIEATKAIKECDYVVGFSTYVNILKGIFPDKNYIATGMGEETKRVKTAFELAVNDNYVCLVCSGDSQMYGMAGLAYEIGCKYENIAINTIPGVSAAFSGSAILGAALGNDMCSISLSDYHTEWKDIIHRLQMAAQCDFVIALYNVRSRRRPDGLKVACQSLMEVIDKKTVCGIAQNIGRYGEYSKVLTLEELETYEADMFTTVFIGNSKTVSINGKMITPRGYEID